jgi:hypothetical protein
MRDSPEVNVHPVAAVPNSLTIEYMPLSPRLFEETPAMVEGQLVLPDRQVSASSSTRRRSSDTRSTESEEPPSQMRSGPADRSTLDSAVQGGSVLEGP